jgi:two-component system, chemotaxis family, chemotaxis protein CheY
MFDVETRILLVEDTDITRAIVKKMLEKMGFKRITETPNGSLAWNEIRRAIENGSPYGVIIADWNMPEMTGVQLLSMIQTIPSMRRTPFIMLTSNTDKDQVVEAIRAGVNLYLAKPFPASALERKIKEGWDMSQRKIAG